MDLVDADRGVALLSKNAYPLNLGYVGLINSTDQSSFTLQPYTDTPVQTGHQLLKHLLLKTLTTRTRASLASCITTLKQTLTEARYTFKVVYNDEPITAEGYVGRLVDGFKHDVATWLRGYTKASMRNEFGDVFYTLAQKIMNDVYFERDGVKVGGVVDHVKLETMLLGGDADVALVDAAARMTKSGIGKITTSHVHTRALQTITSLLSNPTFTAHPTLNEKLLGFTSDLLDKHVETTQTQVENTIKPFKFEVEITADEWKRAYTDTLARMTREREQLLAEYYNVRGSVGRRKYRHVVSMLDKIAKERNVILGESTVNHNDGIREDLLLDAGISLPLLDRVTSAQSALTHSQTLQHRIQSLQSSRIRRSPSSASPEIYLGALSEKLGATAALFVEVEYLRSIAGGFDGVDLCWRDGRVVRSVCGQGRVCGWLAVQERMRGVEEILREIEGLGTE